MADENDTAPPAVTPEAQSAPADTPPSPSQTTESASPPSTEGDTGQSKQSLLDAVLKVVPATTEKDVLAPAETPAPPDPDTETKPDKKDQAETEPSSDDDDETISQDLSPPTRKRIRKLLDQRRELRDQVTSLEQPAQIGRELENFARTANLKGDEVTGILRLGAQLKAGDYAGFYKAISPYVRTAQEYLGIVLPRDLQARVSQGQMTEAAARDYARQRFDGQRAQISQQETQALLAKQSHQAAQDNVHRAVSNFELRLSANDPDYKAKAPAVKRMAQAMLFERGGIQTVEDALEITRAAYDEVNKQIRSYQPRPASTAARPNGSTQAPAARSAPKTLMEAAIQGLEQSRRTGG